MTVVGDSEIFVPEGERCKVVRQVEGLWKGLDGRRRETLTEFHANGVVAARSEGDLWVRPLGSGSGPAVLEGLASLKTRKMCSDPPSSGGRASLLGALGGCR